MAIAKKAAILILCFALASYADAVPKQRPTQGPDIFAGQNVDQADDLLPGEKTVSVMDHGAVADGVADSTQAFMNAWKATCSAKEQTRLLVPAGKFLVSSMFFSGPCQSKHVSIQVDGTVLATTDISEYENGDWLMFQNINGLKIFGGGTFDGQGQESWKNAENCDASKTTCVRMASSLYFSKMENLLIQNITSVNPKGFHIFLTSSANVRIRLIKLTAPDTSPNTDGIHISNAINVQLSENTIATGDDCVAIIQGATNVTVDKVTCGPGHGISIGSLGKVEDELEVQGVRVTDCKLIGTDNGLRIKSWPEREKGAALDVQFTNIVMENVKNPIIIDQEYQCSPNCKKKPSLVQIKNVKFTNVKGTTVSPVAVDLRCSQQFPCEGVELRDIDLKNPKEPATSRCVNVKPVYGGTVNPPACP